MRVDEEPAIQICGISADERTLEIDLGGRALEVLVRVDVPGHHAEEPAPAPIPRQEPRGEVHATNDPEAVLIVLNFVPEVTIVEREAVILRPLGPVAECPGPHTWTNTWRAHYLVLQPSRHAHLLGSPQVGCAVEPNASRAMPERLRGRDD